MYENVTLLSSYNCGFMIMKKTHKLINPTLLLLLLPLFMQTMRLGVLKPHQKSAESIEVQW